MLLEMSHVFSGYTKEDVLHDVSLCVHEGEIVTLIGANGAGKTTTLLSLSGLVKIHSGSIKFQGKEISTLPTHQIISQGIGFSPEGHRVFGVMSVVENLKIGAFTVKDTAKIKNTLEWVFTLFPRLNERKEQLAGTLSGGEQQMLAIGRALMAQPRLLVLDEPSLGLAPLLIQSIFQVIKEINANGVTLLIVEQNARAVLRFATRGYVFELGRVVAEGTGEKLLNNSMVQKAYLGI